MTPLLITTVIAVVLLMLVSVLTLWLLPRESWYDEVLKRLWKDTKGGDHGIH